MRPRPLKRTKQILRNELVRPPVEPRFRNAVLVSSAQLFLKILP